MTKSELFPCFCKGFFDFIKSLNKKRFLDKGVDRDPIHFGCFLNSGRGAVRLAHLTGGQGVVGSNPIAPTRLKWL